MPLMIWAAAIIEAGIENWIDFAILIFIQLLMPVLLSTKLQKQQMPLQH
jgi:hypothetical protein